MEYRGRPFVGPISLRQWEMEQSYGKAELDTKRPRRRRREDKYALIGALVGMVVGGLLGSLGPAYAVIGGVFAGAIVGAVLGDIIGKRRHRDGQPPASPA